ncbi:MAG: hypothetical protein LBR28_07800 [Bacteroidales bacterium]|nr:hypothetical protein [Bacteroidales bacterium]
MKPNRWKVIIQKGLSWYDYSDIWEKPKWWSAKYSVFSFRLGSLFNRWINEKNKN